MLEGVNGWTSEVHRYFPEWAARPARGGFPHESDRNSYLAGGYAEEFGYDVQPGCPASLARLAGDPERSEEWCIQMGALHPGYPERGKPLEWEQLFPLGSSRNARPFGALGSRAPVDFRVLPVRALDAQARADLLLRWRAFLIRRRQLGRVL